METHQTAMTTSQRTPGKWQVIDFGGTFGVRRIWPSTGWPVQERIETLNRPGTSEPRSFRSDAAARAAIRKEGAQ